MGTAHRDTVGETVQIAIADDPLRGFSMALVLGHDGSLVIESNYDFPYTVGWLADHVLDAQREGDVDYPAADEDGDWAITVDGRKAVDIALVMAAFDNGGIAAACIPDARGRTLGQDEVLAALHSIQTSCMEDLLRDAAGTNEDAS